MPLKINLGCGQKYLAGYVNCDLLTNIKADKYFNFDAPPYPFESECAEEILLDNVLEHLDDIPKVMDELHRVLRAGGALTHPACCNRRAHTVNWRNTNSLIRVGPAPADSVPVQR